MVARHGRRRTKSFMGTTEFGRLHRRSDSRIRQLIGEERIWPKPRKVGKSWAIDADAIILDPPERQGFQKLYAKIQQGNLTTSDVEDFVAQAKFWIERGIR